MSFDSPLGDAISVSRNRSAPRVVVSRDLSAGRTQLVQQPNGASYEFFEPLLPPPRSAAAVEALEANLSVCGAAPSRYHVHRVSVAEVLAREPNPMAACSIIYADPPYDSDVESEFFHVLEPARFPSLHTVVVEHRTKRRLVPQLSLRILRERRFGDTTLTYLVPSASGEEG
jgi:hypothetical protein